MVREAFFAVFSRDFRQNPQKSARPATGRGRAGVLFWLTAALSAPAVADVHLSVNAAGGAQFATVQSAIDSIPIGNTTRYVISIAPGTYTEQVRVNKSFVTLRGTGATAAATVLTFNEVTQPGNAVNNASTAIIRDTKDFFATNLTFANTAGQSAGQALAMRVAGDRSVFENCRFLGWQDTLRPETGRHYFQNCYIEGSVDYVYGKGQAYFEDCTLFSKVGGYVTAQGREGSAETNGFVFHEATVTGSAPNDSVYLGRPWQLYSRAIFLESSLGDLVNPAGWSQWSGNSNHLTAYFAEYANTGPGAIGTRPNWTYQLNAPTAAAFTREAWLSGADNWNPLAVIPEPTSAAVIFLAFGIARRQKAVAKNAKHAKSAKRT